MIKSVYNLLDYQALYQTFLISQKYSKSTVKNYFSDLNHCFKWLIKTMNSNYSVLAPQINLNKFMTVRALDKYFIYLHRNFDSSTVNRRYISIQKFCSFAVAEKWLQKSPIDEDQKDDHVSMHGFEQYLSRQGNSKKTKKQYSADISEFINVISSN